MRIDRNSRLLVAGLMAVALTGCSSAVHLHDAKNAKISKDAEDQFKAAEVTKIVDVETANLASLLARELDVVRENRRLRTELEILGLAQNDRKPVADLVANLVPGELQKLGFSDVATARTFLIGQSGNVFRNQAMIDAARRARAAGGPEFPDCVADLPDRLKVDEELDSFETAVIEAEYTDYRNNCERMLRAGSGPDSGELNDAQVKIVAAQDAVLALRASIKEGKADTKALAKERKAAADAGKALDISKTLKSVDKSIGAGIRALGSLGNDHPAVARIAALQKILQAVADGTVEKIESDEELKAAARKAQEISSLAQGMANLLAKAKAPSVSDLLLALNQQRIEVAGDEARLLLARRRVDLREDQHTTLTDRVRALVSIHDQLCNFAVLSVDGATHPGQACDGFGVEIEESESNVTVNCTLATGTAEERVLADCALARTWPEALNANQMPPRAKAALFTAIGSVGLARQADTRFIESEYHLIDLDHREAVAANRLALQSWNNLVAVPVETISGYHAGGVKPEEISELIVQALGFGAITTAIISND